ncbi:MAG TPA: septum formation initiator family protein [Candidatus Pacearchaeota archaeon]|nr:septum formation initiator family protein [Candidatus Pacearchaeota archaeon]HPR79599.1 septum formation initiator family protein [Candidatus Pacearchaeota archaeon]
MLAKKYKKVKWGIHFNKRKISIVFWSIFGFWFIFFLLYSNIKIFQKRTELNKNLETLDSTVESLTKEKDSLNFSLGETNSSEYLEKVAREDLGMQKPGEQVVIIKKDSNVSKNNNSDNNVLQIFTGFVNWIKGLFKPE